jgi:hypothetical protein
LLTVWIERSVEIMLAAQLTDAGEKLSGVNQI